MSCSPLKSPHASVVAQTQSPISWSNRVSRYVPNPFSSLACHYKHTTYLLYLWVFLDTCLLGVGLAYIALGIIWANPSPILGMVLLPTYINLTLALGTVYAATFLLSLPALYQSITLPPHKPFTNIYLKYLNWLLSLDILLAIAAGITVWFRTLQERNTFFLFWESTTEQMRTDLQNTFSCCGYYDQCSLHSAPVCVDPITSYADTILNRLFTSMFGSVTILVLYMLTSLCLVGELVVLERFRLVDAKLGRLLTV